MEKRFTKTEQMVEGPYRCCDRCGRPQDARATYEQFCSEACRMGDPTWPTEFDLHIQAVTERAAVVAQTVRALVYGPPA